MCTCIYVYEAFHMHARSAIFRIRILSHVQLRTIDVMDIFTIFTSEVMFCLSTRHYTVLPFISSLTCHVTHG